LVSGLPRNAVRDLISLGEQVLDRVAQVGQSGAQHEEGLFEASEVWWCPRRVIDELWSEDLVENVYAPRAPAFPEEFVEATDNSLILFRHRSFFFPYSRAYASNNRCEGAIGISSWTSDLFN
jgi:hypothetical protein